MVIPVQSSLIPVLRGMVWIQKTFDIQLTGTYVSAWLVHSAFAMPLAIYTLRNFMMTLPISLIEAAKVDGAGFLRIYWQIFIPLGMAALVTVAIFAFLGSWNDLFSPLIYLSTQEKMTVALGLAYLRGRAGSGVGTIGVIMAGSMLVIIPMLLLYGFGQRYFIQGLARSGLKG